MATIIYGSYMVRYPLGGMLSWQLQYLIGLKELGHDVYFVEKYVYSGSCYNPVKKINGDDCAYGLKVVAKLFRKYGLANKWCFVEKGDIYHGLSKQKINDIFHIADLFIDTGSHGGWDQESTLCSMRIFVDQDPGYTQIKWYHNLQKGISIPSFDRYYTIGWNIGKPGNIIPTFDLDWGYTCNAVNTNLFKIATPPAQAPYSTIMNWKSYDNVEYEGIRYGQKDVEFEKFSTLPSLVNAPMEMAVSGLNEGMAAVITGKGWTLKDAQQETFSVESFADYVRGCKGEFSVCKNGYVETNSAWFSDKSALFLANARPVVVQDTGFSKYLPCGEGLFAVNNLEEAKIAINEIEGNYKKHSTTARDIALEYLESKKVLQKLLTESGL